MCVHCSHHRFTHKIEFVFYPFIRLFCACAIPILLQMEFRMEAIRKGQNVRNFTIRIEFVEM